MNLTCNQQAVFNAVGAEFTSARALAKLAGLSSVCVISHARALIDLGLVTQEEKEFQRSPFRIKKGGQAKPNFDKLLFSTNF